MDSIYIFGSSGHAKVIIDIVISNNKTVAALVDDNPLSAELMNIPIISTSLFEFTCDMYFLIAVGNNRFRKNIVTKNNFKYDNAIHKTASISNFVKLGIGNVVMPSSVINADATIGNHCIINSNSVVEHDCFLEDFVHISPSAALAGNVFVGEGAQVGIGACVKQGIKIGRWSTIGAGSVIINDVPDYAVVVGNPGRLIKYNSNADETNL